VLDLTGLNKAMEEQKNAGKGFPDQLEQGVLARGGCPAETWEKWGERCQQRQLSLPKEGLGDEGAVELAAALAGGGCLTVRALPGRLSALSVFLCKSVLYGAFVGTCRPLNRQKRRFPARAVRPEPARECHRARHPPRAFGSRSAAARPRVVHAHARRIASGMHTCTVV
jgi:hypothetical protein